MASCVCDILHKMAAWIFLELFSPICRCLTSPSFLAQLAIRIALFFAGQIGIEWIICDLLLSLLYGSMESSFESCLLCFKFWIIFFLWWIMPFESYFLMVNPPMIQSFPEFSEYGVQFQFEKIPPISNQQKILQDVTGFYPFFFSESPISFEFWWINTYVESLIPLMIMIGYVEKSHWEHIECWIHTGPLTMVGEVLLEDF